MKNKELFERKLCSTCRSLINKNNWSQEDWQNILSCNCLSNKQILGGKQDD